MNGYIKKKKRKKKRQFRAQSVIKVLEVSEYYNLIKLQVIEKRECRLRKTASELTNESNASVV